MKVRDRKALDEYVAELASLMGLVDWDLGVSDDPAPEGAEGRIFMPYGRKYGRIELSPTFLEYDAERMRHVITHELVHCHTEPMTSMVRGDLEGILGKPADHVFWLSYKRLAEYAVDAMAAAWALLLPLPQLS